VLPRTTNVFIQNSSVVPKHSMIIENTDFKQLCYV